jgi:hypothetical protein
MIPLAISINVEGLHAALSATGFCALGILLLIVGHMLFHAIDLGKKLTGIDFKDQLIKGNLAAAIYGGLVEAAFLLGLAYIIGKIVAA